MNIFIEVDNDKRISLNEIASYESTSEGGTFIRTIRGTFETISNTSVEDIDKLLRNVTTVICPQ